MQCKIRISPESRFSDHYNLLIILLLHSEKYFDIITNSNFEISYPKITSACYQSLGEAKKCWLLGDKWLSDEIKLHSFSFYEYFRVFVTCYSLDNVSERYAMEHETERDCIQDLEDHTLCSDNCSRSVTKAIQSMYGWTTIDKPTNQDTMLEEDRAI